MAKAKKDEDATPEVDENSAEVEAEVSEVPEHPPIYSEVIPGMEPINPYVDNPEADPHENQDEVAPHGSNTPADKGDDGKNDKPTS